LTIEIHAGAIANAGADQVTCGALTVTLAANPVAGGNWTGGTGTFNPGRNTANAVYTLNTGELAAGVTITWNVPDPDGAGPCTATSDDMIISTATTTANAGPDQIVCSNTPVQLAAVGNSGR
jgi:hypothetical protein